MKFSTEERRAVLDYMTKDPLLEAQVKGYTTPQLRVLVERGAAMRRSPDYREKVRLGVNDSHGWQITKKKAKDLAWLVVAMATLELEARGG